MGKQDKYMEEQFNYQDELQRRGEDERRKSYLPNLKEQQAIAQAAVIAQTNPSLAIRAIVANFEGKVINEYGEEIALGQPLMNRYGSSQIASYLIPIISDPIRYGNIDEREVRSLTLQIIGDIITDIGKNWRDYGISNTSVKDLIIDACETLILITLTRSEEQGEKNWLSKIVLESMSGTSKNSYSKKEGIWDKFKL